MVMRVLVLIGRFHIHTHDVTLQRELLFFRIKDERNAAEDRSQHALRFTHYVFVLVSLQPHIRRRIDSMPGETISNGLHISFAD